MSIHRTSAGTYRVRWRHKGRLKSKNFRRKVDAEKFQAAVLLDQVDVPGVEKESKGSKTIIFREFADIWIRDHAEVYKAPSSVIRDKQTLRDYLLPSLGHVRLDALERKDFSDLQGKLIREGRLSPKTVNTVLGQVHKMMEDAVFWGFCEVNPVKGIRPIKIPEREYRYWTVDERDLFLEFVKERKFRLVEVVAFAVHTGLRRGEVEGLMWDCVDFERKEVIVKRNFCHKVGALNEYTKGKNIRRVPLNVVAVEVLRGRWSGGEFSVPLASAGRERVFEFDFEHVTWRHLKKLARECGVREISFHDLRHTFASHLAMAGVSVWKIQQVLGHSDIKTTMRYMHLAPGHLDGVTDVLV